MVWTSKDGHKCPVSPADRGEFMKPSQKSVPALQAPHNSGERVQNGDTALAGADTPSSVPKLGDIVTMNRESPYFSDWRGIEMKIVSLRLAPDGKLWASVIERPYDQGYRGYGTKPWPAKPRKCLRMRRCGWRAWH